MCLIKKISIKENNTWKTRDIGASANNVSLETTVLGESSVENALHKIFPAGALTITQDNTPKFMEIDNNGKIKISTLSERINNFFKDGVDSGLAKNVNTDNIDNLISNYISNHQIDGGQLINPTAIEMCNLLYPIGSVYISFENTNPTTLFGGTWEAIEEGRFLRAVTSSSAGATGGADSKTATFSLPISNIVAHINSHSINANISGWKLSSSSLGLAQTSSQALEAGKVLVSTGSSTPSIPRITLNHSGDNGSVTLSSSINTVPKYITVHMWKRTDLADPGTERFISLETNGQAFKASIISQVTNSINNSLPTTVTNIIENNSNIWLSDETKRKWDAILP